MSRKTRYIIPQIPHHALQRGNNRQAVFYDVEDRTTFLSNLIKNSKKENVLVGSYCLMTNHIHLLLYPQTPQALIKLMKSLAQLHTQYINRKYKRTGKLWENRYKLNIVDPNCEWIVARYIERNPVRAGIVKSAASYQYSSATAHLKMVKDELLTEDIIQDRGSEYLRFFNDDEADKKENLKNIQTIIEQEKAWGNIKFIKELEDRFKAVFRARKRGRPAKGQIK